MGGPGGIFNAGAVLRARRAPWRGCAAALCVAMSACAGAPVRPSARSTRVADTLVDAKVAIAPTSLSTTGAWPAGGAEGEAALRRFLVDELNHMIAASSDASVTLPTAVVLEHAKRGSTRETLRARLTTHLPSGDPVETRRTVPWTAPKGLTPCAASPDALASPVGGQGCCLPAGTSLLFSGGAGGLVGAVAAVGVGAAILVGLDALQYSRVESSRTTAFSNGLQQALLAHAQAVRYGLAFRSGPVPVLEREDDDDEPTIERELPSEGPTWDQPPDTAGDPVDTVTP